MAVLSADTETEDQDRRDGKSRRLEQETEGVANGGHVVE